MKGCRRKGESVEAKTVRGRDSQLQDLNSRFSESVTTLLRFSVALDPKKKSFNVDDICKLSRDNSGVRYDL